MVLLFEGKRFKATEEAQRIHVEDKLCGKSESEFIGASSFEQAKKKARNLAKVMAHNAKKYGCGPP